MPSILQKCKTLIIANLHGMIDRAIEIQSTRTIDEFLYQLEKNLTVLEDSTEIVRGSVQTLKRKYEEFAEQAEKIDRDIDTLLLRKKDELPVADDSWGLHTKAELAQEYYVQWQSQQEQLYVMIRMRDLLQQRITFTKQLQKQFVSAFDNKQPIDVEELHEQAKAEQRQINQSLREQKDIEDKIGIRRVELQLKERKHRLLGNDNPSEPDTNEK